VTIANLETPTGTAVNRKVVRKDNGLADGPESLVSKSRPSQARDSRVLQNETLGVKATSLAEPSSSRTRSFDFNAARIKSLLLGLD
jgi:hypothetical protein